MLISYPMCVWQEHTCHTRVQCMTRVVLHMLLVYTCCYTRISYDNSTHDNRNCHTHYCHTNARWCVLSLCALKLDVCYCHTHIGLQIYTRTCTHTQTYTHVSKFLHIHTQTAPCARILQTHANILTNKHVSKRLVHAHKCTLTAHSYTYARTHM